VLPRRREAAITGIGVIAPGCIGNSAFIERLQGRAAPDEAQVGGIDDGQLADLINARRVRRMSEYVKLLLAATTLALRDAGAGENQDFAPECGIILGSTHGAIAFSETYYRQVVQEGASAANPMLFAEGVPNVGSAQLSLMLGVRNGSQTIVGSRTAGLDALRLAALRIQTGVWERAIIGAAEEFHPLVNQAYERCGAGPIAAASGAVMMIVENREAAEARGARAYCTFGRGDSARSTDANGNGLASAITSVHSRLGPGTLISDRNTLAGEMFSVRPLASVAAALLMPDASASEPLHVVWQDPFGQVSALSLTAEQQLV
jgi:3-oxoacyl-(acyl-carrier-protein) synthase